MKKPEVPESMYGVDKDSECPACSQREKPKQDEKNCWNCEKWAMPCLEISVCKDNSHWEPKKNDKTCPHCGKTL